MTYSVRYTLKNKDVNLHRKLRTSALFELLQEASIEHTEELGMGREMTLDRGFLWVVLQQRADIARMPEYGETITIETWPGATMHVLFPRYYRVKDAHDEVLITGSAVWALLDEQTQAVTEYSDALVRRLIERITVYDEMLVVEFKSGLEIEVDA